MVIRVGNFHKSENEEIKETVEVEAMVTEVEVTHNQERR